MRTDDLTPFDIEFRTTKPVAITRKRVGSRLTKPSLIAHLVNTVAVSIMPKITCNPILDLVNSE